MTKETGAPPASHMSIIPDMPITRYANIIIIETRANASSKWEPQFAQEVCVTRHETMIEAIECYESLRGYVDEKRKKLGPHERLRCVIVKHTAEEIEEMT